MPRNHRDVDSQEKRDALVAVARRLVLSEGYEGMGMARVASEAGVAPNTLYWYFEDKDALLIAVLDGLVAAALADYLKVQTKPLDAQLTWLIDQFERLSGLISAVHARVPVSPSLRMWHERFHEMVENVLSARLLEHGLVQTDAALASKVAMFVIEGLLSHHGGGPSERDAIVQFVTGRVVPPSVASSARADFPQSRARAKRAPRARGK